MMETSTKYNRYAARIPKDVINVWSLKMSSVRAPGKYLSLIFCFPDFNRFSPTPAKIESPTMRHVPFGKE